MCHGSRPHAGAAEHLQAAATTVARLLKTAPDPDVDLPLTEDGKMFCGTCHLFHDPALGEDQLERGWVPPSTGMAQAVRNDVERRIGELSHADSASEVLWQKTGTRALRLPVDNGALCLHCHADMVK